MLCLMERWKVNFIENSNSLKLVVSEDISPENHPVGSTQPIPTNLKDKDFLQILQAQLDRLESDGKIRCKDCGVY